MKATKHLVYALKAEESLVVSDCDDSKRSEESSPGLHPYDIAAKVVQIITGLLSAPPDILEVCQQKVLSFTSFFYREPLSFVFNHKGVTKKYLFIKVILKGLKTLVSKNG